MAIDQPPFGREPITDALMDGDIRRYSNRYTRRVRFRLLFDSADAERKPSEFGSYPDSDGEFAIRTEGERIQSSSAARLASSLRSLLASVTWPTTLRPFIFSMR